MFYKAIVLIVAMALCANARIQPITDSMKTQAIKLTKYGFDSLSYVDKDDSMLTATGIRYSKSLRFSYFPNFLLFDSSLSSVGIGIADEVSPYEKVLWLSAALGGVGANSAGINLWGNDGSYPGYGVLYGGDGDFIAATPNGILMNPDNSDIYGYHNLYIDVSSSGVDFTVPNIYLSHGIGQSGMSFSVMGEGTGIQIGTNRHFYINDTTVLRSVDTAKGDDTLDFLVRSYNGTVKFVPIDTLADTLVSIINSNDILVINIDSLEADTVSTCDFAYVKNPTSGKVSVITPVNLRTTMGAQPLDVDLTALAGLSTTGAVYRTGSGTAATFDTVPFARDADLTGMITGSGTTNYGTMFTGSSSIGNAPWNYLNGIMYSDSQQINKQRSYYDNILHAQDVAHYENLSGGTGTIKITLPVSWTNTIVNTIINGHKYGSSTGSSWQCKAGGYLYSSTNNWLSNCAEIMGGAPFKTVRLAHDGTNACILLGNTSTNWGTNIGLSVDCYGYRNNEKNLLSGWSISLITNESGITVSGTPSPYVKFVGVTVDSNIYCQLLGTDYIDNSTQIDINTPIIKIGNTYGSGVYITAETSDMKLDSLYAKKVVERGDSQSTVTATYYSNISSVTTVSVRRHYRDGVCHVTIPAAGGEFTYGVPNIILPAGTIINTYGDTMVVPCMVVDDDNILRHGVMYNTAANSQKFYIKIYDLSEIAGPTMRFKRIDFSYLY